MKNFLVLLSVILFVSILNYFFFDRELSDVLIGLVIVLIGLGFGYLIKYFHFLGILDF